MRSKTTGKELALPSWRGAASAGLPEQWATSLMLIDVSTRKFGRAVRLPEAGVSAAAGSWLSKSAVSRRFNALTEARLCEILQMPYFQIPARGALCSHMKRRMDR